MSLRLQQRLHSYLRPRKMKHKGIYIQVIVLLASFNVNASPKDTKRSDFVDHGSHGCGCNGGQNATIMEAMLQQQAATIQTLQTRLEALETALLQQTQTVARHTSLLENVTTELQNVTGRVDKLDLSVGFYVDFGQTPFHDVSLVINGTVKFSRVLTNEGNGYNASTGVFTAPVSGLYTFFLHLMAGQHGGLTDLAIFSGSQRLAVVLSEGNNMDSNDQNSCTTTVKLQAGQEVDVRLDYGQPLIWGSFVTSFSGILVRADPDM